MPADYEVGYKRPPKSGQFRKGQSGNPPGRPKGARNLKTDLAEELGRRIALTLQGKSITVTKQRALIMALCGKAIKGDTRAASLIINMINRLFEGEQTAQQPQDLTSEDQKILEAFVRQHSSGSNGGET